MRRNEEQAQAIDRAAFQRALSQRVTKAYLLLAQGIEPATAAPMVLQARATFERHLAWLQGLSPSAEASRRLIDLGERWAECRAVLQRPPDRAGAQALYRISDQLESTAHRAAIAFEAAYDLAPLRGLMVAGRLRMLSERMTKFWLYRRWDLNVAAADMELHLARAHFTATLVQVERLDLAPPTFAAIGLLKQHWPAHDALLQARDAIAPVEMLRRSEQTLASAQAVVQAMLAPVVGTAAPGRP